MSFKGQLLKHGIKMTNRSMELPFGSLTTASGITVEAGGITVSCGDVTVDAGTAVYTPSTGMGEANPSYLVTRTLSATDAEATSSGQGTYTATMAIPMGYLLVDAGLVPLGAWTSVTSAAAYLYDSVSSTACYLSAVDVKALSSVTLGGGGGLSYCANSTVSKPYAGSTVYDGNPVLVSSLTGSSTFNLTATIITCGKSTYGQTLFYGRIAKLPDDYGMALTTFTSS